MYYAQHDKSLAGAEIENVVNQILERERADITLTHSLEGSFERNHLF